MAHFKTMDQTKVTDLTRITIGNAKFYQTLILENSTFIKHNTDSIMITYVTIYFSYAICVPLSFRFCYTYFASPRSHKV